MCGIIGVHRRGGGPTIDLAAGLDALGHRGPDGRGAWSADSGVAALGHTRLAIVAPRSGAQPIVSEDGRRRIVVNGEFYGFERTRAELRRAGHTFATGSDSEIALHLYEDLGEAFVHRLRGQFALLLWDDAAQTLIAVRDRFGIKPLFHHDDGRTLRLASEAKALFALGVDAGWDLDAVYRTLHACPDPSRSLFADVRQVPPGHMLVSTASGTRLEPYWDLPPHDPGDACALRGAPLVERVRGLVEEGVRIRMRADVPVGCLLSGGLDSSSVLGLAAAVSPSPVTAFTVAFDDAEYDESASAAEVAALHRARHHVVRVSDGALADAFADAVAHAETVQYNAHGTARFLLSRAVRDAGYKSVLAGEGADEAFYGYEFTRGVARLSRGGGPLRRLKLLPRLLRRPAKRFPGLHGSSPWLARLAVLLDAPPALLSRLEGSLLDLRSTLRPEFTSRFAGTDVYREWSRRAPGGSWRGWEPARRLTYLWLRSLFVNYHLAADRLDMAHGVEVRFPFLDHELFEFIQRLPLDVLVDADRDKPLLRDAMRAHVPASVHRRTKKPFWAPPTAAAGGSALHGMVLDTLHGRAVDDVPFLDARCIRSLLKRAHGRDAAGQRSMDSLLLLLASFCVLQGRYGPA